MADTPNHDQATIVNHVQRIASLENQMSTVEERFEEHCKGNIAEFAAVEARLVDRFDAKVALVLANIDKLAVTVTQVNGYLWRVLIGLIVFFAVIVLAVLGFERLVPAVVKGFVP